MAIEKMSTINCTVYAVVVAITEVFVVTQVFSVFFGRVILCIVPNDRFRLLFIWFNLIYSSKSIKNPLANWRI